LALDERLRLADLGAVRIAPERDVLVRELVGDRRRETWRGIGRRDRDDVGLAGRTDGDLAEDLVTGELAAKCLSRALGNHGQRDELDVGLHVALRIARTAEWRGAEELLVERRIAEQQRSGGAELLRLRQRERQRAARASKQTREDQPPPPAEEAQHRMQVCAGVGVGGVH